MPWLKRQSRHRRWIFRAIPATPREPDPRPSTLVVAYPNLTTVEHLHPAGASVWAVDEPRGRQVVAVPAGYRRMIVLGEGATVRKVWPCCASGHSSTASTTAPSTETGRAGSEGPHSRDAQLSVRRKLAR